MNRTIPRKKVIRPALILAVILFATFVARMIFIVEPERSELGDVLSPDSQLYYDESCSSRSGSSRSCSCISWGAGSLRPPEKANARGKR